MTHKTLPLTKATNSYVNGFYPSTEIAADVINRSRQVNRNRATGKKKKKRKWELQSTIAEETVIHRQRAIGKLTEKGNHGQLAWESKYVPPAWSISSSMNAAW